MGRSEEFGAGKGSVEITHVAPPVHDFYDMVVHGSGRSWSPDSVGSIHEARQWAHHVLHGPDDIDQVDVHGGTVPQAPHDLGPLVESHRRR